MTKTNSATAAKDDEKLPATKHVFHSKAHPGNDENKGGTAYVAPSSPRRGARLTLEEENKLLRSRNRVLRDVLKGVQKAATEQMRRNFELVWFARNRNQYPNDEAVLHIQNNPANREDIAKLLGPQGEYYHGFNTGLLAASRMYKEYATLPSIKDEDSMEDIPADEDKMEISNVWDEIMLSLAAKHAERIEESRKAFPETETLERPHAYR